MVLIAIFAGDDADVVARATSEVVRIATQQRRLQAISPEARKSSAGPRKQRRFLRHTNAFKINEDGDPGCRACIEYTDGIETNIG
jgi:FAD/FMN-containing dehydrogenase